MRIHPAREAAFWPLLQNAPIGSQLIAGKTLHDLQEENAHGIGHAHQIENAWITHDDWLRLAEAAAPAAIQSNCGTMLAWIGDQEIRTDNSIITASADSFLLRHAWDFLRVNQCIVAALTESNNDADVSSAAHIDGFVRMGKGTKILPGVMIEGNVIIGKNGKIGPNCYLRGATTIGDNCHIGQAVEIKNSIIGHGSSIGHLSYVGDSVIGSKVNFGAGTITSNLRHDGANHRSMVDSKLIDTGRRKFGTIVGDGTHTGIHTAIYPGRKLGPASATLPNDTVKYDIT